MNLFPEATQSQFFHGLLGAIITALILAGFYFTWLRSSRMWTIIVTPLASIIGSGFLVVAPLLYSNFGSASMPAIIFISLFALAVGLVMRTNIKYFEPLLEEGVERNHIVILTERLSNLALGISYVISIAFYLNLLSSFALEFFRIRSPFVARSTTSILLAFIGGYGYLKGLHGLEALEKIAVNAKLSIIGALVLVLVSANLERWRIGVVSPALETPEMGVHALQILGGMLLITQGFETARYLGKDYTRQERAKAMLLAQLIATLIYILFVALAQPFSSAVTEISETAIIQIVGVVAVGLPAVLSLAAIFSQFGAGVADTVGAGGILEEESHGRVPRRAGYIVVCTLAIVLIWSFDIFEVLTLASRAFAAYYGLQAVVATIVMRREPNGLKRTGKLILFPFLAVALFAIALFAIPAH